MRFDELFSQLQRIVEQLGRQHALDIASLHCEKKQHQFEVPEIVKHVVPTSHPDFDLDVQGANAFLPNDEHVRDWDVRGSEVHTNRHESEESTMVADESTVLAEVATAWARKGAEFPQHAQVSFQATLERCQSNDRRSDRLSSLSTPAVDDVHSVLSLETLVEARRSRAENIRLTTVSEHESFLAAGVKKVTMKKPWYDYQHLEKVNLRAKLGGVSGTLSDVSSAFGERTNRLAAQRNLFNVSLGVTDSSLKVGRVSSQQSSIDTLSVQSRMMCTLVKWRSVLWLILGFTFWIYDVFMLPIELCFKFDHRSVKGMEVFQLIALIFWTVDIPSSFVIGSWASDKQLQMDLSPQRLAMEYLKTWFFFDLSVVVQQWVVILAVDKLVWSVRLLQMVRLLRYFKMRILANQVSWWYSLSSPVPGGVKRLLELSAVFVVGIHLVTCLWYGLSSILSNSWVDDALLQEAVHTRYIIALHWSCSRLHGLNNRIELRSDWELILDSTLILFSVAASAFCVAEVTAVSMMLTASRRKQLKQLGRAFVRRHKVPLVLTQRIVRFLERSSPSSDHTILAKETDFLSELPTDLQNELLFQARWRSIYKKRLFVDMLFVNPRVVRHLCIEAMSGVVAREEEVLFTAGDACNRSLVIRSGGLEYRLGATFESIGLRSRQSISDFSPNYSDAPHARLTAGNFVSEAVLWMSWEHCGSLLATVTSILLCLDPDIFASVVLQYTIAMIHATKYAKRFTFNMMSSDLSDIIEYDNMTIDELDEFCYQDQEGHFVFISHYKVEAGTEATLLIEAIESQLDEDVMHPANALRNRVFVDSENLEDLNELQAHVTSSNAVILLLTPGLLSRAWCLIEVVTAIRHGVVIVPVEIQRPGVHFHYPDEEFYMQFVRGQILSPDGVHLLEKEGFSLSEVEQALRRTFQIIALPFSPQKTKAVRDAELGVILKRIQTHLVGDQEMRHTVTKPTMYHHLSLSSVDLP